MCGFITGEYCPEVESVESHFFDCCGPIIYNWIYIPVLAPRLHKSSGRVKSTGFAHDSSTGSRATCHAI